MQKFGNHMETWISNRLDIAYRFKMQEQVRKRTKDKEDQAQWHKTSNS